MRRSRRVPRIAFLHTTVVPTTEQIALTVEERSADRNTAVRQASTRLRQGHVQHVLEIGSRCHVQIIARMSPPPRLKSESTKTIDLRVFVIPSSSSGVTCSRYGAIGGLSAYRHSCSSRARSRRRAPAPPRATDPPRRHHRPNEPPRHGVPETDGCDAPCCPATGPSRVCERIARVKRGDKTDERWLP